MVVPAAVPVLTWKVTVREVEVAPLASVVLYVQTTGPALPAVGVVQVQFAPPAKDC